MANEMPAELTVAVYESDAVTVVELAGELDVTTTGTLREALAAIDLAGGLVVRMDLTSLSFLDTSGIGVVVNACRRIRASGGTFWATCKTGIVRRTLEVSGLVEYLQLD